MTPGDDEYKDDRLTGIGPHDTRLHGLAPTGSTPPAAVYPVILPNSVQDIPEFQIILASATPLTALEFRPLGQGFGSVVVWTDCSRLHYLTWSVRCSHTCRLDFIGSIDPSLGMSSTLYSQIVSAGVLATPYTLGAPFDRMGFCVITKPFVYFQMRDLSGVNHTYSRIYVHLW